MMKLMRRIAGYGWNLVFALLIVSRAAGSVGAAETGPAAIEAGAKFTTADTLACGEEPSADTKECLAALAWKPGGFDVELAAPQPGCGDFLVRFASPRPIGNATNDRAAMEWFAAHDDAGAIKRAPAIVVVHESGGQMTVGRLIARGLSSQGIHAFMLHLPGYGVRRAANALPAERTMALEQSIADARRARDAVAALPAVDKSAIGLQGTSLGGFVSATTAGLDRGYSRVFIFLAGGNLEEVVLHGKHDAEKAHKRLTAAGVSDERIKELAHQVEPLRLAHRLDPAHTWMFNGTRDDVVKLECSRALATAAHLADDHRVEWEADHYSGVIYLPKVINQVCDEMRAAAKTVGALPAGN